MVRSVRDTILLQTQSSYYPEHIGCTTLNTTFGNKNEEGAITRVTFPSVQRIYPQHNTPITTNRAPWWTRRIANALDVYPYMYTPPS